MLGTLMFYILWPAVWFYAPLRVRVRVVVRFQDEILLIKNWFGPQKWQLPGGGMKFGESVIETAARELKEELHIDVDKNKLHLITKEPVLIKQFGLLMRVHFFLVEVPTKLPLQDCRELADAEWHSIENLNDVSQEVDTALKLV